MKKLYLVGLALLSVLAFSAIAAGSAFAEEALWLIKGGTEEVLTEMASETTGSLKLIHLAGGFLEPEAIVECSGTFLGTVGPGGADLINTLVSLTGEEATLAKMIPCTNIKNCVEPLVAPDELPWDTQLELMSDGRILDVILNGGYEILCMQIKIETLCFGNSSSTVELMTGSTMLLALTTSADIEASGEEGTCGTHAGVATQEGEGEIKLVSGEELDVSSP